MGNQIADANAINMNEASMSEQHQHNFEHDRLLRALCISLVSSVLTYPLYAMYTRIAFDIDHKSSSSKWNISSLYQGYSMHILYNVLFESLLHYSREYLIKISPQIHSNRFVNR